MAEKFIQKAIQQPGAFAAQAKAAGTSVAAFARRVLANPGRFSSRTVRRANLARTLRRLARRRKAG